jgi:hypothetical protein
MATEPTSPRDRAAEAADLAGDGAAATSARAEEVAGEVGGVGEDAQQRVRARLLKEAPYAAKGLGSVAAQAARDVDAETLAARVRHIPAAVVSRVNRLGVDARTTYLALVARGRGQSLREVGDSVAATVTDQVTNAAESTAEATAAAGEQVTNAAATTTGAAAAAGEQTNRMGGRVRGAVTSGSRAAAGTAKGFGGKLKRAATRSGKPDEDAEREGDAEEAVTADGDPTSDTGTAETGEELDTGSGPLEERTVAQLRQRAGQLGIGGRAGMRKADLVAAIRDAT